MIGGFSVTVIWKLLDQPFGLGAAIPGSLVCGLLLVFVSLATYKAKPSVVLEV